MQNVGFLMTRLGCYGRIFVFIIKGTAQDDGFCGYFFVFLKNCFCFVVAMFDLVHNVTFLNC